MSILFIFFLLSRITRKLYGVYANIMILNDCSATESILPFLVCTSYDWRATAKKRSPAVQDELFVDFWGFCHVIRVWHVWSGHTWTIERVCYRCATSLAKATASKQKLDYSFLYLLDVEDHLSATEALCVWHLKIPLDLRNAIAPVFEGWVVVTSDHLDKGSVWKSHGSYLCV